MPDFWSDLLTTIVLGVALIGSWYRLKIKCEEIERIVGEFRKTSKERYDKIVTKMEELQDGVNESQKDIAVLLEKQKHVMERQQNVMSRLDRIENRSRIGSNK